MITQNIINSHHNLKITLINIMIITQTQLVAALTKILLFGLGTLLLYYLITVTIIVVLLFRKFHLLNQCCIVINMIIIQL